MHKIISCTLFLCFFVVPGNAMETRNSIGSSQKDPHNERNKQAIPYSKQLAARKRKAWDKENYLIRKQERCKKESINFGQ